MSGLSSIVVNPYLILLLICHLLSDYYFQSQKMADRKDQDKKVLGLHILYVALPLIVVSFCHLDLWWICLVILLTHATIDFLKPIVQKQLKLPKAWTFALDQVLHIAIISCLVLLGAKNGTTYLPIDTLNLIFYVLLVGKPSNISFKIMFAKYQTHQQEENGYDHWGWFHDWFFRAFGDWCLSRLWAICFYRPSIYGQIYRPL